eukprot:m.89170 g.89170  ORF g.89170 m.89170 type:complete len:601 (+) comp13207_c1_seq1:150-1952(+)
MFKLTIAILAVICTTVQGQCGPDQSKPYPPGSTTCPQSPPSKGGEPGGNTGGTMGGAGQPAAGTKGRAASLLGDVATTTATGKDERTGNYFSAGENIYGPFEAGFGSQQNNILESLGCSNGNLGHLDGGIDTYTAEQMVAYQCDITLPRIEGDKYISLLDECGGHTMEYHFHERMSCLYKEEGTHSAKIGEALDGQNLYGKWENYETKELPLLDACGGHFGYTPESPDKIVYHYHVQEKAPFTIGCFGPNENNTLVTVEQCRSFYPGCDGDLSTVTTPQGSRSYDKWCPCFDADGSNTGISIKQLPVFSSPTSVTALDNTDSVERSTVTGTASTPQSKIMEKPDGKPDGKPDDNKSKDGNPSDKSDDSDYSPENKPEDGKSNDDRDETQQPENKPGEDGKSNDDRNDFEGPREGGKGGKRPSDEVRPTGSKDMDSGSGSFDDLPPAGSVRNLAPSKSRNIPSSTDASISSPSRASSSSASSASLNIAIEEEGDTDAVSSESNSAKAGAIIFAIVAVVVAIIVVALIAAYKLKRSGNSPAHKQQDVERGMVVIPPLAAGGLSNPTYAEVSDKPQQHRDLAVNPTYTGVAHISRPRSQDIGC